MRKLIKVRNYRAGYQIRYEEVSGDEAGGSPPFIMRSAYTPEGHYIGNPKTAHELVVKRGIKPGLASPDDSVCSVGFCEREQKWYGWSHRALYGFGIGDVVETGDLTAVSGWTEEYLEAHPGADRSLPVGFAAHSLDDARRMAVAFAEAVS